MNDTIVSIRNISKRFGKIEALSDISIDIKQGEIFALLGPSGCGKSTLLRIISGFESPSKGELLLDGQDMTSLPPNKRPINMVFQSYAVFPHMSVQENVAYGLKMEKVAANEIASRVSLALDQVHLADFAQRKPDQLSGGQRQRVALARALVKRPRVLLLDEPLSALDAKLRDAMRLELVKLQETVGITFIIVTHDQSEAMAMADRIAVLESGKLCQMASPANLYTKPVNSFVADFIGNINAFNVEQLSQLERATALHVDQLGVIEWYSDIPEQISQPSEPDATLAVRPEHVLVSTREPVNNHVYVKGILGDIAFQGQHSIAEIKLQGHSSLKAVLANEQALELQSLGSELSIWAHWDINHMLLLPNGPSQLLAKP